MNTTITKIFTATIAVALTVLLTSAYVKQSNNDTKFLTMRTYEMATKGASKLMIAYEDGKIEELELGRFVETDNVIKINQTINSLTNKGYELVSTSGDYMITTYIFRKK